MYNLVQATIEITRKCNAKCIHCIVDAGAAKNEELTNEQIMFLLEDLADLDCKAIALTGGDPFMREEWPLFLQKASSLGLQTVLMTNALAIDEKVIDILKRYDVSVGISLDGPDSETHDYVRGRKGTFEHFVNIDGENNFAYL